MTQPAAIVADGSARATRAAERANRVWFLQVSRAVACLTIVLVHWLSFVRTPNVLQHALYARPLEGYAAPAWPDAVLQAIATVLPSGFREVYFGLGLFFLTSGYVIPLSMDALSPSGFLVRRVLRIYPTAIVCTLLTYAWMTLGRAVDGNFGPPVPWTAAVANALIVRDLVRLPFVDTAIWTLEIEVHFYALCFALAFFRGHRRPVTLLAVAALFALATLAAAVVPVERGPVVLGLTPGLGLQFLAFNGAFILLMLVGTALFQYQRGYARLPATLVAIVVLLAADGYALAGNQLTRADAYGYWVNHLFVALAFAGLMLLNARLPYSRFLNGLADASYSLYLLHGTAGYAVFYIAYKTWLSPWAALAAAATWIIGSTLVVNRWVERPSIRLGRSLTSRPVNAGGAA